MQSIERSDFFSLKYLPNIYFCDENGKVLFFSESAIKVIFKKKTKYQWKCKISDPIGNFTDYFELINLLEENKIKYVFFRTTQKNLSLGKEVPFCFKIRLDENIEVKNNEISFSSEDFVFFDIFFNFYAYNNPCEIKEEYCPNCIKTENGKLVIINANIEGITKDRAEEIKERLIQLKNSRSEKLIDLIDK